MTTHSSPLTDHDPTVTYQVVVNDEEQYSIWLADQPPPAGWRPDGTTGTEQECLDHVDEVWTDLRPLSLRRAQAAPDAACG